MNRIAAFWQQPGGPSTWSSGGLTDPSIWFSGEVASRLRDRWSDCGAGLEVIGFDETAKVESIANEAGGWWAVADLGPGFEPGGRELGAGFGSDASDTSDGGARPSPLRLALEEVRQDGPAAFDRWLGPFAFVAWDQEQRRLICARDRSGLKPLHWARAGETIAIASEPAQLLALGCLARHLNLDGLARFLEGRSASAGQTFYRHIEAVEPGSWLEMRPKGTQRGRFAAGNVGEGRSSESPPSSPSLPLSAGPKDPAKIAAERVRQALSRAVQGVTRNTSGPLAVALSGGLDSSIIAGLVTASGVKKVGDPEKTQVFAASLLFPGVPDADETDVIRASRAELGLVGLEIDATQVGFLPESSEVPLESPFFAWQPCLDEMLRRTREAGCTILLTGHGGDDLFTAPSNVYRRELARGHWGFVRRVFREGRQRGLSRARTTIRYWLRPWLRSLWGRGSREADRVSQRPPWLFSPAVDGDRVEPDRSRSGTGRREMVERREYAQAVDWYDRAGWRLGVEICHPFLDASVVDVALEVPDHQLVSPAISKPWLRQECSMWLPSAARTQNRKTSLGAYLFRWLQQEQSILQLYGPDSRLVELGLCDGPTLTAALRAAASDWEGYRQVDSRVWQAVMAELWLRRRVEVRDRT